MCLINTFDKVIHLWKKRSETLKFKDKRRKKIYNSFELTKEQRKKIDSLYKQNYGKKIPYTWHKHFSAFSGKFDETYFPELHSFPMPALPSFTPPLGTKPLAIGLT